MSIQQQKDLYHCLWRSDISEGTEAGDVNWQQLLRVEKMLLEAKVDILAVRKG